MYIVRGAKLDGEESERWAVERREAFTWHWRYKNIVYR